MTTPFFTLEIITPTQRQVHTVEWIEVESPTGSFLVGPDHRRLISIIKNKSTLRYKKTNAEECDQAVPKGIFTVGNNRAIALLDQ
jgi:F0F1-type ATP synthase epsilon subunit